MESLWEKKGQGKREKWSAVTSTVFYALHVTDFVRPHHLQNANADRAPVRCTHSTDMSVRLRVVGKRCNNSCSHVVLYILHFTGVRCVDFHTLYDQPFQFQRGAHFHLDLKLACLICLSTLLSILWNAENHTPLKISSFTVVCLHDWQDWLKKWYSILAVL